MPTVRILSMLLIVGALAGCSREGIAPTAPSARASAVRKLADDDVVQARDELLSSGVIDLAAASIRFDVAPEIFGTTTPIDNRLNYVASNRGDGSTTGSFYYVQSLEGSTFEFSGEITCLHLYDFDGGTGNRAKLGGLITASNDPAQVGRYIWWQQIDNQRSPGSLPDKSTLSGFGDAAANQAFCTSPNPPRFGPFEVDQGNITVKRIPVGGNVQVF